MEQPHHRPFWVLLVTGAFVDRAGEHDGNVGYGRKLLWEVSVMCIHV